MCHKDLIAQMTIEEKASLCAGSSFWYSSGIDRLHIPSVMMTDGPHGLRKQGESTDHLGFANSVPTTCFPSAATTACSFDPDLLTEMGVALGEECIAEDVQILLGPGVNIKRSPLCGRNFEYFSEDPYLAGKMGAAHIRGVQSKGIGTSIKHYAANNQETRRMSSDSRVDERTLYEIYYPAFECAVKEAQPTTVMCSYNRINGTYASESYNLLTEVLRDQWGFEGLVVSDWGATNRREDALAAGMEWQMPPGGNGSERIVAAIKAGKLKEETLNLAVERILSVLDRVTGNLHRTTAYDKAAHHALAGKIAAESMVLLKNNGILPLKKDAKVAVIGEFAVKPRYQGAGSSQIYPTQITTPLEAIKTFADVTYSQGFRIDACDEADEVLLAEAVKVAQSAEVCLLFIGLPPTYESEGFDREHLRMPAGQCALLERIAATCPNVVVVLQNGAPVEMPWLNKTAALLEAYLGGQNGGSAIAEVLFGVVNPSGKLAETFPLKLSDNPSYLYYIGEQDTVEYREGVFVGYRYYDKKEMDVLFPFGYGLSYTTFEYSNLKLSVDSMRDTDTLTVTVDIKNTGAVEGKEIVQLYVAQQNQDDRVIRPVRELRGFQKVALKPGETKTVGFELGKRALSYYNTIIHDFHVLSGIYNIQIGASSRDLRLCAPISIESTVSIPMRVTVNTPMCDMALVPGGKEFLQGLMAQATKGSAVGGMPDGGTSTEEDKCMSLLIQNVMKYMVLRSMSMFAPTDQSLEEMQSMLDATIGIEGAIFKALNDQ